MGMCHIVIENILKYIRLNEWKKRGNFFLVARNHVSDESNAAKISFNYKLYLFLSTNIQQFIKYFVLFRVLLNVNDVDE